MTAPALPLREEVVEPSPPLRSGRHRNRALASWRKNRAVELAASGRTYQQIADELGYANRGTVHRIVRQALEAQQVENVARLRELEVRRLDALQVGLWAAAMAGDIDAVNACLRIIEARIKVLGLAELGVEKRSRCRQPQTVILLNDDCRKRRCPEHT